MALGTYSELQSAIADELERADLTTQILDFIARTETKINAKMNVRTLVTDATLTGTIGSRFIALPTGYRDATALWRVCDGGRVERGYLLPEQLNVTVNNGDPYFWTVDGSNIAFEYPLDQAYSYVLRKVGGVALSDAAPTNLILTNYPTVYLYGAMVEASMFLRDPEMRALYGDMFTEALTDAKIREGHISANLLLRTDEIDRANRVGSNIYRGV